ncbi:MAG: hypothetical protein HY538_01235 [Deltaproteobacteria bacterium]|nr:hypothetical protein [Deltaproteobacteria bacterium]
MIPTVVVSLKYLEMRNWVVDILKGRFNKIKMIVVPSISRRDVTANLKHWDGKSPLLVIMDVPQLATESDWVAWRRRLPQKASTLYLGPASPLTRYVGLVEEAFIQSVEYFLDVRVSQTQ